MNASGYSADYIKLGCKSREFHMKNHCTPSIELSVRDTSSVSSSVSNVSRKATHKKVASAGAMEIEIIDGDDDMLPAAAAYKKTSRVGVDTIEEAVATSKGKAKSRTIPVAAAVTVDSCSDGGQWLSGGQLSSHKKTAAAALHSKQPKSKAKKASGKHSSTSWLDDVSEDEEDPDFIDVISHRPCDVYSRSHTAGMVDADEDTDDDNKGICKSGNNLTAQGQPHKQQQTTSLLSDKQKRLMLNWLTNYRKRWKSYWNYLGDLQLQVHHTFYLTYTILRIPFIPYSVSHVYHTPYLIYTILRITYIPYSVSHIYHTPYLIYTILRISSIPYSVCHVYHTPYIMYRPLST